MKKIILISIIFLFSLGFYLNATEDVVKTKKTDTISRQDTQKSVQLKYLAAAIAIGCATLASGLAIGKIGSAAMGAVSEKPEAGGTAIILAALAEGVSLWGFLIAFFILQ